jgi:lysophospholipase L1-like esterase
VITRRAALAGLALLPTPALAAPPAARPIDRLGEAWWRQRHAAKIAEAKQRRIELVLLGDSITQNLERDGPEPFRDFRPVWQRFFAHRNTLNLGFRGDATSHLLWRMRNGELAGLKPRAAVILIGANNMGRVHWPAGESIEGIRAVVAEARERLAGAKLVLMSVLPSVRSPWVDETTGTINRAIAGTPGVMWHDATPVFMKAGRVDPALFYDGALRPPEPLIHPTPAAMMAVYAGMERLLG